MVVELKNFILGFNIQQQAKMKIWKSLLLLSFLVYVVQCKLFKRVMVKYDEGIPNLFITL